MRTDEPAPAPDTHPDVSGAPVGEAPVSRLGTALFRAARAQRDVVAAVLRRRGWSFAVLPFPGYGVDGSARVLARVVLAAPGREPSAVRGVAAWRRLLTLQRSRVTVEVTEQGPDGRTGQVHRVRSGPGGIVDVALPWSAEPGTHTASWRVGDRPPVQAPVHVADPGARAGIVCDIDDTALVTGLDRPLSAAWRTLTRAFRQRVAVEGVPDLLAAVHDELGGEHTPVVYLSTGPWNFADPLTRFLHRNGFPAGALLMTDWGPSSGGVFRDGRAHKRRSLQRLRADFPDVRWFLVGDDGENDPAIYEEFARENEGHVLAVALRQVGADVGPDTTGDDATVRVRDGAAPVVRGTDGHVLLRRYRAATGGR
ncbi:App1 family protein [Kineococcus sp. SYSU DK002]|uniref:App1 family protein n=1 Tax=Kineococcus sp. SYSU DK002 TaxID=3383123 RepID=UPI003D7ED4F4